MSQGSKFVAALAAALVLAALPPFAAQAQEKEQQKSTDKSILVFAAASLKNALDEVDAAFAKQSGINVVASYGTSRR